MRSRNLLIFAALTLLLALGAWWVQRGAGDYRLAPGAGGPVYPQLPAQAAHAARIHIESTLGAVDLRRVDGEWRVVQKADYPADVGKIADLLRGLAALRLQAPRTADPARHGELDLTGPRAASPGGTLLEIHDEAGRPLLALILGKQRSGPAGTPRQVYLRRAGEDQAWLANGAVDVGILPKLWLHRALVDIPQTRVQAVQVLWPGEAPYTVSRAAADAPFELAPLAAGERANAGALNAASYALQSLVLQDVQPVGSTEPGIDSAAAGRADPLADWGQAPLVRFRTFDGLEVSLRVVRVDGTPRARLTAQAVPEAAAGVAEAVRGEARELNQRFAPWVYELAPHTVETFARPRGALLDPTTPAIPAPPQATTARPGPPPVLRGPGRPLPFPPPAR